MVKKVTKIFKRQEDYLDALVNSDLCEGCCMSTPHGGCMDIEESFSCTEGQEDGSVINYVWVK